MNNQKSYKIIVHSKKMRNICGASPAEVAIKVASKLLVKNIYSMYFSIVEIKKNKIIHYYSNKKELVRPYHKNGKLVKYRIIVKKMGKQVGGTYPPNLEDPKDPIFTFFPKERYIIIDMDDSINIINKSNNKLCIEIRIEGKSINILTLHHCGYNGRTNLEAIIEYSKELNKESKIIESLYLLIDGSFLKHPQISLSTLYILSIGSSWYNQFGFISEHYMKEIEHNNKFLTMTLEEFLNECIKKIIDNRLNYYKNINNKIKIYLLKTNSKVYIKTLLNKLQKNKEERNRLTIQGLITKIRDELNRKKEKFIRIFGNKNISELFTEIRKMLRGIELSEEEIMELEKKDELPQELKPIIELFDFIERSRIIMYNGGNLYLML
jgi:hypothetical protein